MMKPEVTRKSSEAVLELGRWMGRREAFALTAGRCDAAEVESLLRIRDGKMYEEVCRSWDVFCTKHLGMSRRNVQRLLGLWKEFGASYFHIAQMTHLTPDEYRALAPHVTAEGLRVDGAPIALIPENTRQVAEGVAEILRRERPAQPKAAPSADTVIARFLSAADALCALEGPVPEGLRSQLSGSLVRVLDESTKRGLLVLVM